MYTSARDFAFHDAVILFIGQMCGSPHGRVINRKYPSHIVTA
jgi:hypothetical protein